MGYLSHSILIALYIFGIAQGGKSSLHTYTENEKIAHLIAYVASLNHAIFIRNNTEHSATDAASHLKMKWERAGSKIKTATDFIRGVASKSTVSGQPYKIRFANGKEFNCELILTLELQRLEKNEVPLRHLSK